MLWTKPQEWFYNNGQKYTENHYVNSNSNLNQIKFYFEWIIWRQSKKRSGRNLCFGTETKLMQI